MLTTLAIANYRSLRDVVLPLGRLNLVTGPNGSGKSNLYRALRLLADTASGSATASIAREGGLESVLWAGPEQFTRAQRSGEAPIEGAAKRSARVSLRLGFVADELGYAIDLGLPTPVPRTLFNHDPEIKREVIWHGDTCHERSALIDRRGPVIRARDDAGRWQTIESRLPAWDSLLAQHADPARAPEALVLRESIRSWRFYDHFRTDAQAPARQPQVGTRTPVLDNAGRDLAAAWQTIVEIGDAEALAAALDDAFPGSRVRVTVGHGRMSLAFDQPGLLRPLAQTELSDGTLRYLLWIAALMTPRPPALMVLNEPETSLHPDLLPALGRLMLDCAEHTQLWVTSHAPPLIDALVADQRCNHLELDKTLGETFAHGFQAGALQAPAWKWPAR